MEENPVPESTVEANPEAKAQNKLLRNQGAVHLAALLTAIAVWVSLDNWATDSGFFVASVLSAVSGIAAGIVVSHIFHEWGHFIGAKLSGAGTTIKENPAALFFDFDYVSSSPRQYLWLSAGGPLGNILVILITLLSLPLDTTGQQWLFASMIGNLVFVLFLELPVSQGIRAGREPLEVIATHFGQGDPLFQRCTRNGIIAGVITLLLL